MVRSVIVLALVVGCAPETQVDLDHVDDASFDVEGGELTVQPMGNNADVLPPPGLSVTMGALMVGDTGVIDVTGADPLETVFIAIGVGSGPGPCPPPLGGLCLDVNPGPVFPTGTDKSGVGAKAFPVPNSPGLELCAQAVAARGKGGVDSVKSDVSCNTIEGLSLEGIVYMADGSGGTPGALWELDLATLSTTMVGPVVDAATGAGYGITGLAFAADGTLYGSVSTNFGSRGDSRLVTIDPSTGSATTIGALIDAGGVSHHSTADITVAGSRLLGWTEAAGDNPIEIDTATGAVTVLSTPAIFSRGSAMATDGDTGVVYALLEDADGAIWTVDLGTGMIMNTGVTMNGSASLPVNSATFHNGMLLAIESNFGASKFLTTIDPATGNSTPLMPLPIGVDSIASSTP